jgi:methylmalonyl-CoA mutase N-terminal domain/subunit
MRLEKLLGIWEKEILNDWLKEHPERKERFITDVGLEIERLYTPLNLNRIGFEYERDLGLPGEYPFTRGITPTMYRSDPFLVSIYSGFGSPKQCNKRYKKILQWGGVDEIAIAADLPSQVGYDSDAQMAKGEVGKVGVAIDTLRDMEILFEDIPLNKLKRVSLLGNSIGPIALSLLIALGEKQGLNTSDFVVNLQNDVLKEYIARGTYIFPIRPAVRLTTDVIGYCAKNIPHWYPINICANHINAAGAGSSKATAFALANGMCYINHLLEKGYHIDEIAPLFTIFLDERANFFVAICNFRATRRIWAKIMREELKASDPKSMALKIYAYSHGGETRLEPMNNIVRITLAALAYVLGGVQYLENASYDEVLRTPSENASKIAVRTQQILAHELGITDTVDPLGGSYFIETLTAQIESEIYRELSIIEERGSSIEAIEDGYFNSCINEGAIRRQREFDKGEKVVIGVNRYRSDSEIPQEGFRIDPSIEMKQIEQLKRVKKERNNKTVKDTLEYVREIAKSDESLVPPVLEAVRAYATIGEICAVLREVFGEYQAREYFNPTKR